MSESESTKICKRAIYKSSGAYKLGIYGAFEVTLGDGYGCERVDYMTMTSDGVFTCYEVKVSKSDLYSKAKKTFCGDKNYFVMPRQLFEELKGDIYLSGFICSGVGIYTVDLDLGVATCVKKSKKKNSFQSHQKMMFGMIRSLSRYTKNDLIMKA